MDTNLENDKRFSELKEAFDLCCSFSKEKNKNTITKDDLKTVMNLFKQDLSDSELNRIIELIDVNGDDEIDFLEFVLAFKRLLGERPTKVNSYYEIDQSTRKCLEEVSHNKKLDAGLDAGVLVRKLEQFGVNGKNINKQVIEQLIKESDINNDGKVDITEFIAMLNDDVRIFMSNDED